MCWALPSGCLQPGERQIPDKEMLAEAVLETSAGPGKVQRWQEVASLSWLGGVDCGKLPRGTNA